MKSFCPICTGTLQENKWYPKPISEWREVILSRVYDYKKDDSDPRYAIFSNVAYNLQFLEYINKCLKEEYLSSVIRSQLIKTFTLTSSQIIECLLNIKLIELKVDENEIWEFSRALKLAEEKNVYGLGNVFYKNELRRMKDLRNRIHLQSSQGISDADYAVFESVEVFNEVKKIVFLFMQKCLKISTEEMNDVFYFLLPFEDFVHSKRE